MNVGQISLQSRTYTGTKSWMCNMFDSAHQPTHVGCYIKTKTIVLFALKSSHLTRVLWRAELKSPHMHLPPQALKSFCAGSGWKKVSEIQRVGVTPMKGDEPGDCVWNWKQSISRPPLEFPLRSRALPPFPATVQWALEFALRVSICTFVNYWNTQWGNSRRQHMTRCASWRWQNLTGETVSMPLVRHAWACLQTDVEHNVLAVAWKLKQG